MTITNWIFWLAIMGAADSLYTALQQKFPRLFEFCFEPDTLARVDCYDLLHGKYAKLFLVPNSWLGVVGYSLLAWIFSHSDYYVLGAVLATLAFAMSVYLVYVQFKKLKTLCIFCLTSASLITVITVLSWIAATGV